jgi:hypothetical protein
MTWDEARIARERAICEAATEGPWTVSQSTHEGLWVVTEATDEEGFPAHYISRRDWYWSGGVVQEGHPDQTFIAHARTALPEALDEIERLQGVVNDLAFTDPMQDLAWAGDPFGCTFCTYTTKKASPGTLSAHDNTCAWRRANEAIGRQP